MEVRIRKSKHQKVEITDLQFKYASACASDYMRNGYQSYMLYGCNHKSEFGVDVYRTKTTISAVVYFK